MYKTSITPIITKRAKEMSAGLLFCSGSFAIVVAGGAEETLLEYKIMAIKLTTCPKIKEKKQ